jgi:GntR family transcriptional regulator
MVEKNIPIYQIIEKDLRVAILDGKLKQGDLIPSETELCAKYKVSRMTVRQAINNLLIDGYIYRHKGRGTFVTFNKIEMDNQEETKPFFSFSREMVLLDDGPVNTVVMSFSKIKADEIVAKRLQLEIDTPIYYVERLRSCNNIPLVYERLYLPVAMYPELHEEDFYNSFYDYVQQRLNFKIRNSESSIEARALSEKVADILHQSVGEPSLYMSSSAYLENGRAFVYTRQYFHANHFRFKHKYNKKSEIN